MPLQVSLRVSPEHGEDRTDNPVLFVTLLGAGTNLDLLYVMTSILLN